MNPIKTTFLLSMGMLCGVLQAQQVFTTDVQITSTNAAAPNLKTTGPGGVLFGGTFGSGSLPTTGDGARFMWYPKKAALRVGWVDSGRWDDANIGDYSMGIGANSIASGYSTIALGSAMASGHQAFAAGWGSQATGSFAAAVSVGTATNYCTFAAALGTANGYQSVALGGLALGSYSTAIGINAQSVTVGSTVVGQYNELGGNPTVPANTDAIFIVGTGTGTGDRKNGFEVRRDGTVRIAKRQGDIVMGVFGNGGGD